MSLETALSIAGFAVSLGGLIPVFFLNDKRKEIVFAIVITVLFLISAVAVYRNYQHWKRVDNVSREIVIKLSNNIWTLDQLFQALYYVEFDVFHEALNRAINNGTVHHEILEVRDSQGTIYRPRVYYVNKRPS